jgi:hypothetical protein
MWPTGFGIVLLGWRFDVVLTAFSKLSRDARLLDVAELS